MSDAKPASLRLRLVETGGYAYFARNGQQWFDWQKGDSLPFVRTYGVDRNAARAAAVDFFRARSKLAKASGP